MGAFFWKLGNGSLGLSRRKKEQGAPISFAKEPGQPYDQKAGLHLGK
jgi:hypothetical protein